jgi:hypothetical protein
MVSIDKSTITPLNRAHHIILTCNRCHTVLRVHIEKGFDVDNNDNCVDNNYLTTLASERNCENCGGNY